jgi:1-acyl-sn-glycerol-3-phosphate acyltransferase
VAIACGVGLLALRVFTLADGYGRIRRGTVALQWSSRLLLRSLRIRVVSTGAPRSGPSLVVANGRSVIDVMILAAAGPLRPAVDSAHLRLPLIGATASRAGAVGGTGQSTRQPLATVAAITAALRGGSRVLVFPCQGRPGTGDSGRPATGAPAESTAGTGASLRVRPAVIQSAVDAGIVVTPVVIRRPSIPDPALVSAPAGGCGDLAGVLWRILRSGPLTVQVDWLAVIPAIVTDGHPSRHRARTAERAAAAINRTLAGTAPGQPVLPSRATSTPATAKYLFEPRSRMVLMPRFSRSA